MTLLSPACWTALDRQVPRGAAMVVPIGLCLIVLAANYHLYRYFYAAALSSDGASFVVLARHLAAIGAPVSFAWFYPNTDIILVGPHLFGLVFNWLLGFGIESARAMAIATVGFCYLVFAACFRSLTRDWLAGLAGAAVTLAPFSNSHVEFVQIQTSYIFQTAWLAAMFALYLHAATAPRRIGLATFAVLVALFFGSNPLRGIVFLLGPILGAEILHILRHRAPLNVRAFLVLILAALLGSGLYLWLVRAGILFGIPGGYSGIRLDPAVLLHSLGTLSTFPLEFFGLAGHLLAIFSIVAFVAAAVFAIGFFAARRDALWFAAMLAGAAGLIAISGVLGGIFGGAGNVRYFFPALLPLIGLVASLLVRARARLMSQLLLVLIAISVATAALSLPQLWNVPREFGIPQTPHALQIVADRLTEHGIHRVYIRHTQANVLNVLGRGAFLACFVIFNQSLLPFKWSIPKECYEANRLPDRFAVVIENGERDAQIQATIATLATQPEATVPAGPRYTILIFKTAAATMWFLSYPIPDGWRLHLPIEDSMVNPQMYYRNGVRAIGNGSVAFDGQQPNGVAFGPYITLPRGHYRLIVYGSILSAQRDDATVLVNGGPDQARIAQTMLKSTTVDLGDHVVAQLDLTLAHQLSLVAFAVLQTGHGRFTLSHFRIEKAGP